MTEPNASAEIFDPRLVRAHRARAAARLDAHDFLFREVAARLADRLNDFDQSFPLALEIGGRGGELTTLLDGHGGIGKLIQCAPDGGMADEAAGGVTPDGGVAAEADAVPLAESRFDLAISSFALHWINDLPGALLRIRRALKPDGLFLAAMPGGATLCELRAALTEAEVEVLGGASPRVSPFTDIRDAGALLQRAGFALPVADSDTITVDYESPFKLMADLRGMGETNALAGMRRGFTPRAVLFRAAEIYRDRHAGPDGRVPATFQIVYLTGWAPHESRQKSLTPGSVGTHLAGVPGEEMGS